jgi:uncharacterized membrane protein
MNQQQFLKALREALETHQVGNVSEILIDYQEHFNEGLRNGKTEEVISAKLGYPTAIAKAYQAESMIREVQKEEETFQWSLAFQIIGRFILIAPLNFFILFIPGVILFSLMMAAWGVTFAVGGTAVAILAMTFKASIFSLGWWAGAGVLSVGFATMGLAFLLILIGFLISKHILLALISYLQWNLKFVLDKK